MALEPGMEHAIVTDLWTAADNEREMYEARGQENDVLWLNTYCEARINTLASIHEQALILLRDPLLNWVEYQFSIAFPGGQRPEPAELVDVGRYDAYQAVILRLQSHD